MPRIRILAIGKIKEDYILEGIGEYLKRMKNRKIEIVEIKDSDKQKEGREMTNRIERLDGFLTIALDEHGKELTSIEFSEFLRKNLHRDLCLIIGGPDGLDSSVAEKADYVLALSRMTFNHEMARLFLVEQLYRAYSIIKGKKYHRS